MHKNNSIGNINNHINIDNQADSEKQSFNNTSTKFVS